MKTYSFSRIVQNSICSQFPVNRVVQATVFTLTLFSPILHVNAAQHSGRNLRFHDFPSPSGVMLSPALITRIANQNLYLVQKSLPGIRENYEQLGYARRVGGSFFLGLSIVEGHHNFPGDAPDYHNNFFYFTLAYTKELPFSYLRSIDAGLSYVIQQVDEYSLKRNDYHFADFGINFTFIENENAELVAGAGFMQSKWYFLGVANPQFFDVFTHYAFFKRHFFISASAGFNDAPVSPAVASTGSNLSAAFQLARLGGFLNTLALGYDYGGLAGGRLILRDDDSGWLGVVLNPLGFFIPGARHNVALNIDYGPEFLAGDNSGRGRCFIFRLDYNHIRKKP